MSVLRFQIRQPSGQIDQLFIESERVLIGSGAHCEIRLPLDQAAVEHCLVQLAPAGVFVQALSFQPPPTVNGIPFTQGPLPPDAVLGVGQFQINVTRAEGAAAAPGTAQAAAKKKSTGPLAVVALAVIGAAAYFLLFTDDSIRGDGSSYKAPDLWGGVPVTQCTQPTRDRAAALAIERFGVGNSLRERRPFHVQDGVAAVPIYELAAACFRVAGDEPSSTEALAAANTLRKELNDDYRTHRVRLEHSLKIGDLQTSRREVRALLNFTEGKQGDYVTWLSSLDRDLKLKLGKTS